MSGKVTVCAGTITLRHDKGSTPRVLLVHRPRYDDWSLPKGHLEPDEYAPVAARRETREESGVTPRLGRPAGTIRYPVGNGTKVVHYWLAEPAHVHKHKPDKEVDKVAWLTPKAAASRMSYADERALLHESLAMAPTTPVLVVRHGKAMLRKNWSGRDQSRPIVARGRKQAKRLVPLLEAFGVERVMSSSSLRCVQTMRPYAQFLGTEVVGWSVLSEEVGEEHPVDVTRLMHRLAREAGDTGVATAVCGHRPVLPTMLEALGVPVRPLPVAATVVAHVDGEGHLRAHEFFRPLV